MHQLGIKVKNYKCFEEETGFDELRRVNLIIGRNNSGKSSLLDIIEIASSKDYVFDNSTWRNSIKHPQIIFEAPVSVSAATRTFPEGTSGGKIGMNHGQYGKQYIGRKLKWTKTGSERNNATIVECDDKGIQPPPNSFFNLGERR